jgi:hypothetical protein
MKRILLVAVLVVVLTVVGAVAAFAAPGSPVRGFGMMGGTQGVPGGYGHMGGYGMMGQGGSGTMGEGGYGMMGEGGYGMMGDELEELLGIDHADIHAAHVAGKSLVEIADEKGVSEDQLTQALLDGRNAALAQAVTDGKLTQAAADQMLKFMEANIKTMVEAKGMQGMMGAGGMMGGTLGVPGGMMGGTGSGGCHGGQAPAQLGTGVRNNRGLAPQWVQQG